MNVILLLGAALGLSSIMMAAYVDHSLALYLSGKSLKGLLTAVRYHQLYAVVVCMIGLALTSQSNIRMKAWLIRSAYIFSIGIFSFSFSIYFSAMVGVSGISYLTPVGGILLMIGWGCLIRAALLKMS
ncbi:MAG TPA: DUF423 domain-containing protein [Gammaproteobacteria bacterium]|jgi:uncharacterized membrane protein YgdD (TMEM256/DUF423 family)|nr:DUF423 domain-containing protein [Gammaproteobacteria bacterium]